MKNGRPHDVHLPEIARELLRSIPHVGGCDLVFTTTGRTSISGFSQGKRHLDQAIEKARAGATTKPAPITPWQLHDLRRTGVSRLAALGFDSIVVDKLLAHQPARLNGVAAIYQRYDFARERVHALEAWAAHVSGLKSDNVVALRSRS